MFMLRDYLTSQKEEEEILPTEEKEEEEEKEEDGENDEISAAANAAVLNAVSAPMEEESEESESEESESVEEESSEEDMNTVEVEGEGVEEESIGSASEASDDEEMEVNDDEEEEEEDDDDGSSYSEEEDDEEESYSEGESDDESESLSSAESDSQSESESEESEEESDSEDMKKATTNERRSLLLLAAEHDRVDILKAILTSTEEEEEESLPSTTTLLNDAEYYKNNVPALHVAVAHGSTHAASCLLRMGADPSLRPVLRGEERSVERMKFGGRSAWEIAFGGTATSANNIDDDDDDNDGESEEEEEEEKKGWFSWRRSTPTPSPSSSSNSNSNTKSTKVISPLNTIPPSKLEGIKHAFTAEALRAIGSDEDFRLCQLLKSGMDVKSEVGGRDLRKWCVELGASQCLTMLDREFAGEEEEVEEDCEEEEDDSLGNDDDEEEENNDTEEIKQNQSVNVDETAKETPQSPTPSSPSPQEPPPTNTQTNDTPQITTPPKTTATKTTNHPSIPTLQTAITESETLSTALSTILDNLAEEVSVCQSILLDNSSAASTGLASHVRLIKGNIETRGEEIVKWRKHLEKNEGEYNYLWFGVLTEEMRGEILGEKELRHLFLDEWNKGEVIKGDDDDDDDEKENKVVVEEVMVQDEEEEEKKRGELSGQLAVCENKVRKLRTSIASLAEENAKSLEQVEQRGLSGAIQLARTLREELRELDYELNGIQAANASCVTKINIMKRRLKEKEAAEGGKHGKKKKRREVKSRGLDLDGAGDGESNDEIREMNGHHEQSQQTQDQNDHETSQNQAVVNNAKDETVANDHAVIDEKKDDDDDEELTPLMNRNHHLASSSAWLVPVGALLHMNNEDEEKDADTKEEDVDEEYEDDEDEEDEEEDDCSEEDDGYSEEEYTDEEYTDEKEDEYYSDEEEEPRIATRSRDLPSIKIQSGESTSIILRDPESNRYLSIDIWDLIRRIIGIGREVASRSVQSFREDTAHVMTV